MKFKLGAAGSLRLKPRRGAWKKPQIAIGFNEVGVKVVN